MTYSINQLLAGTVEPARTELRKALEAERFIFPEGSIDEVLLGLKVESYEEKHFIRYYNKLIKKLGLDFQISSLDLDSITKETASKLLVLVNNELSNDEKILISQSIETDDFLSYFKNYIAKNGGVLYILKAFKQFAVMIANASGVNFKEKLSNISDNEEVELDTSSLETDESDILIINSVTDTDDSKLTTVDIDINNELDKEAEAEETADYNQDSSASEEEVEVIDAEITKTKDVVMSASENTGIISDDKILSEVGDKFFSEVKDKIQKILSSNDADKRKKKKIKNLLLKYKNKLENNDPIKEIDKKEKLISSVVEERKTIDDGKHRLTKFIPDNNKLTKDELIAHNEEVMSKFSCGEEYGFVRTYIRNNISSLILNEIEEDFYRVSSFKMDMQNNNTFVEKFYVTFGKKEFTTKDGKIIKGNMIIVPRLNGTNESVAAVLTKEVLNEVLCQTVNGVLQGGSTFISIPENIAA